MKKRPICLAAVLIVLWILIMNAAGGVKQGTSSLNIFGNRHIKVQGQVYRQDKRKNLLYLKNISIILNSNISKTNSNIIIYTNKEPDYQIGNIVIAEGIAAEPKAATNPGQFDQKAYYQVQNIYLMVKKAELTMVDERVDRYLQRLADIREQLRESIDRVAKTETAAILCAMILGDKAELDEAQKGLYKAGGISHILAISGLHISLIGMGLYRLLRKSAGGFLIPGTASLILMISYVIMTGASVSSIRAVLMFGVFLGAQILGRSYDLLSALSLAGILVLMEEPQYLFQASFQLSFLAIIGIGVLYPRFKLLWLKEETHKKWKEAVIVSICIQVVTLPCILYWYGEISVLGLLINMVVLPLTGMVMISGIMAAIAGLILPSAGSLLVGGAHYILILYEKICEWANYVSGGKGIWGAPKLWKIVVYYLVIAIIMWGAAKKKRRDRIFLKVLLLAAICLLWFKPRGELFMIFLDVGQGDAIFWRSPSGRTYLCDGGSSTVAKVGTYRIVPFLKWKGVSKLDYVFVTHMDADHINGVKELLEPHIGEIPIGNLVLADIKTEDEVYQELKILAAAKGIPILYLKQGDTIQDGDIVMKCLWPAEGTVVTKENRNENSLVLQVEYEAFRVLLTGDLEGAGEVELLGKGGLKSSVILKAGHHGSKGASSEQLLKQVKPLMTILSYGENNTYGHPHKELRARLEDSSSMAYETAAAGAISVSSNGKWLKVYEYCLVR